MVRIVLISCLVINKICESDEHRECSSQPDFAVKQLRPVLESEDFPFLHGACVKAAMIRVY